MAAKKKSFFVALLLVLFASTSAFASFQKPDTLLQPAIDRHAFEISPASSACESEDPPLPIVDEATRATFGAVSHIDLPPPDHAAAITAHLESLVTLDQPTHLPIFAVSPKRTSGLFASLTENNINGERELGLKTQWSDGSARNRWYDPATGTFLSPDPLGYQDSSNLYAFCAGDPVNNSDPTGELSWNDVKRGWKSFTNWFSPAPKGSINYPDNPRSGETRAQYVARLVNSGVNFQEAAAARATFFPEQQPDPVMLGGVTRGVLMAQKPVYAMYGGLKIASSFTGVGAVSLVTEGFIENGVTPETVTMAVPLALHLAMPRTPAMPPSIFQGIVQTDRAITSGLDAQRALAQVTEQVNAELAANPALAKTILSFDEYQAATRSANIARIQYGNALERLVARRIRQTPDLADVLEHVGGPSNPDFVAFGQNYDITTETMAQVWRHMRRPGYGEGLGVVTYQRPTGFTTFPQ